MQNDFYDSHMHTELCKHAKGEPEEYAEAAIDRGLAGITFTCHNPIPGGYSADARMRPEQFDDYVALIGRARDAYKGRLDVRLGLESDYFPGAEPWLEQLHPRAEFHYILGSVHPQIKAYQARYFTGDVLAFQETYFNHLVMAAETGLFDALSHPDLVKNEHPQQWRLPRLMDHIKRSLDRIAATGIAMELNTSGVNKALPQMNPGPEILAEMARRKIPVVLGSDSHVPHRVGDGFETATKLLKEAGFTHVSVFDNRKRREIPIRD